MARLASGGEVRDNAGLASTVLAAEVGYPGSSIAFAQLLSGMERSGLIEREVRGKRTYRIRATAGAPARMAAEQHKPAWPASGPGQAVPRPAAAGPAAEAGEAGGGDMAAAGRGDFDYDELARRLLVQVVRRLASASPEHAPAGPGGATLEQTVAGLEQELATVRTMHGTLTAENARLREQLRAARQSLAQAQDRADGGHPVTAQLDAAEVSLLERLLAPPARKDTGTGG